MQDCRPPRSGDGGVRVFPQRSAVAFTLVELLTVLAIIAVLAALSFGSGAQALRERSLRERARADLAALSAGLEAFRRHNGSYPQTDRPEEFLGALLGGRAADNTVLVSRGRRFVDGAGLVLELGRSDDPANRVLDPWGRPYRYTYTPGPSWRSPGYLLYSCGPDGLAGGHPGGRSPGATEADHDNVYAQP